MQTVKSKWFVIAIAFGIFFTVVGARAALPGGRDYLIFHAFNQKKYDTAASDMDRSGRVIGRFSEVVGARTGPARGFIRSPDGEFTELIVRLDGDSIGNTYPRAISETGLILGNNARDPFSTPAKGFNFRSWIYDLGTGRHFELVFPGAIYTWASDMNEEGVVVGWAKMSAVPLSVIGFRWSNGVFEALQLPGDGGVYIESINKAGQMSGSYIKSARGSREGYFVLGPDLSFHVKEPAKREWEDALILGDRGDYAGSCWFSDYELGTCFHDARTGQTSGLNDMGKCGYNMIVMGLKSGVMGQDGETAVLGNCLHEYSFPYYPTYYAFVTTKSYIFSKDSRAGAATVAREHNQTSN